MINIDQKIKKQIDEKGISIEKINAQIKTFKEGIPFVNLIQSATIGKGIHKFSHSEIDELIALFEKKKSDLNLLKFVPASGAASRMFKSLFNYLEQSNSELNSDMEVFFKEVEKLPFYNQVITFIDKKYPDYNSKSKDEQQKIFVEEMLLAHGFDYGNYPKGLLPFHKYGDDAITAFEEHLYEAAIYDEVNGKAKLHFTISEDHLDKFKNEFATRKDIVESKTGVKFDVSFSFQKAYTDTIAVTLSNEPFILEDGQLLFRPGGHGALIENLNDQNADIIFIKNIDNVVVSRNTNDVANYKKVLAGILLKIQQKAFMFRALLDNSSINSEDIQKIKEFISDEMNVFITADFENYSKKDQVVYLCEKLDRPIRICGMVKNEGEPGGGPFWIKNTDGNISLQIIESAQIDKSNKEQEEILKSSTHFNPVDIVCSTKDYKAKKYNLLDFVDNKQAFITEKTKDGRELKALELPGLWNGAMANWNTIFVEVPLVTFNPVKTVNDLLKSSHQV